MASVFAGMYVKMIKIGKRSIDDVRPDELKAEVQELLVAEGLYELAGVDEPKVEEDAPVDEVEEPIEEAAPVEYESAEEAPDEEVKEEEPQPIEDEPTEEGGR